MKTTQLVFLATLAIAELAISQDKTVSGTSCAISAPNTARILDSIPGGTSPPPEAPKPEYKVPPSDILQTTTQREGGRNITIQRIKPVALQSPAQFAEAPADPSPEFLQRIAEYRATHPRSAMLHLGATVYRSKDHPVRTLIQLWPQSGGKPIRIWSSADFALIAGGINRFMDSAGNTRQLFSMWSEINTDLLATALEARGKAYITPEIPALPEGKASFQVIGEQPNPSDLTALQSLHDLYNVQYAELLSAYPLASG